MQNFNNPKQNQNPQAPGFVSSKPDSYPFFITSNTTYQVYHHPDYYSQNPIYQYGNSMYSPSTAPIPVDNRGVKSPYAPSPRVAKAGVKITNPETNEPVLLTKSVTSPTTNPSALSSHSSPARSPASISTPIKAVTDSAAQEKKLQFKEMIKKRAAEAEAAQKAAEEKERLEKEAAIKKAAEEAAAKKKAEEEAAAAAQKAKEEAEEKARKQAEEEERAKKQAEEEEKAKAAAKEEEEKKKAADAAAAAAAEKVAEKPTQKVDEETVQAALTSIHGKIQAAQPSRTNPVVLLEKSVKATHEELLKFHYPEGIKASAVHSTHSNVFLYDSPFLLQFQSVVTFPPKENWDNVRSIMNLERSSGSGRQFSSRSNSSRGFPQNMGSFGSSYRNERSGSGPSGGFGMKNMGRMSSNNLNGLGGPSKSGRQNSSRRGRNDRSGSNRGERQSYNNTSNNSSGPSGAEAEPEAPKAPVAPLVRSANAWVPRKKTSATIDDNRLSPEEVQRKVKSLLNKLSLEFFEPITDQLLAICAQSKDEKDGRTLRQVLELTFAKAVDEAHWSKMYAMFCKKMLTKIDPEIYDENIKDSKGEYVKGGVLFRKYLLSKCQEEFERGWSDKLPTNEDGSPLDPALMSDEYYAAVAAKRRGLGLIRFIGELYFLALIAEKIMHACIQMLLSNPDPSEETIESICQLMTTVGGKLEENQATAPLFDSYFERMEELQKTPGLPSRLRFMLMDVADLRRAHWVDKKKDKGPKTLAEIHEDDEREKAAAVAASSNNSRNKFTRPNPSNNNRVSKDELKRLSSSSSINRTSSGTSFGPSSMFNRDSSSRGSRRNNDRGDRSERGNDRSDRSNSSAGTALSKEPSRQPSQRANAFAVLADDGDKSEDK
jgi:translation initiation factor 4G